MEENLGWDEFMEWVMAYGLDPWGEAFDDANHAWTRSVIANANKAKGKPIKPDKFLMKRRSSKIGKKEMTAEQLKASFEQWAAATSNPMFLKGVGGEDSDGSRQA